MSTENRPAAGRIDTLFLAWCRTAGVVVYTPDGTERARLALPTIEPGADVHDTEPRP